MSHFLVYGGVEDRSPFGCAGDPDDAEWLRSDLAANDTPTACVVRMLTGVCPICATLVGTAHATDIYHDPSPDDIYARRG